MSTLPYLQRQLKPRLQELAAETSLQGYQKYNKSDLATALDEHLRANPSRYDRNPNFKEFYTRLARGGRASSEGEGTPSVTTRRTPRRARGKTVETTEEESDNESSVPSTPAQPLVARTGGEEGSPLSPRLVTDAIDQQTERMRQRMSNAWQSSGMTERSDSLRDMLSSVKSVEILVLAIEAGYMLQELLPLRPLVTLPPVDELGFPETLLQIPDLFLLLDSSFWAPFSLWLLTSLVFPLVIAYFFNLSLKAATTHGRTARGRAQTTVFDPLSFNIAKALIAYRVYALQFTFFGVYNVFSLAKVDYCLPGGWVGVLTSSAVAVVATFYEVLLRK